LAVKRLIEFELVHDDFGFMMTSFAARYGTNSYEAISCDFHVSVKSLRGFLMLLSAGHASLMLRRWLEVNEAAVLIQTTRCVDQTRKRLMKTNAEDEGKFRDLHFKFRSKVSICLAFSEKSHQEEN
jgi:hypothetical protein